MCKGLSQNSMQSADLVQQCQWAYLFTQWPTMWVTFMIAKCWNINYLDNLNEYSNINCDKNDIDSRC